MSMQRALERAVRSEGTDKKRRLSDAPKHISLGIEGENLAASYLLSHGYSIIDRNVRYKWGEIDIIALYNDEIVFAEVRTRHMNKVMPADTSVGPSKMAKLIRSAKTWAESRMYEGYYRIDLIAITVIEGKAPVIEHIKDITEAIK